MSIEAAALQQLPEVAAMPVQQPTLFAAFVEGAKHYANVVLETICSIGATLGAWIGAGWGALSTFTATHATGLLVGGALGVAATILGFCLIARSTPAQPDQPISQLTEETAHA